jgi:hypothetical protein
MNKKYAIGLLSVFSLYSAQEETGLQQQRAIYATFKAIGETSPDEFNRLGWYFNVRGETPDESTLLLIRDHLLEEKDSRVELTFAAASIFRVVSVFDWEKKEYVFSKNGLGYLDR